MFMYHMICTCTYNMFNNCFSELLSFPLELGTIFSSIGVYEKQQSASIAFTNFGIAHK